MAEVKKVAFVHGEFPIGGAERVTCDIATALLERLCMYSERKVQSLAAYSALNA